MTNQTRGRPRTAEQRNCIDCGTPITGKERCLQCAGKARRKEPDETAMSPTRTDGKRGPEKGAKYAKTFDKICPEEDCPRKGDPFKGTEKRIYCSQQCTRRAFEKRRAAQAPVYLAYPDSSNVGTIYYDPKDLRLFATFNSGDTYSYQGVSTDVFNLLRLEGETSIGKAFAKLIRAGGFEYRREPDWSVDLEPLTVSRSDSVARPGADAEAAAERGVS